MLSQRGELVPHDSEQAPMLDLISQSPEHTRKLGARLGELMRGGELVLLEGDLGAGKTALTQGIAEGLQVRQVVSSPTFTLLKEYEGRLPLYHFDLYRLDDPLEILDLGFEEYFSGSGVCVVEWADKAGELWPAEHLRIGFTAISETQRRLLMSAAGPRSVELLREFQKRALECDA
jgi:tRNA threonylcarbamoyladenosine biosynthesis protein TsaE